MSRLLAAVVLVVAFSIPALGETVTTSARSQSSLERVVSNWKFKMVNVKPRAKKLGVSALYGCLFWCVDAKDKGRIRIAYTYGEPEQSQAEKKAAYALDSMSGGCSGTPQMQTRSTDDL